MKHLIYPSLIAVVFLMTMLICSEVKSETNTVSTVVTNSSPSTANAPVIPNSNSDICKVGVGGSVQNNVLGVATGILVDDELCQLLKLSRSQYAYGMRVSAVALLCQDPRVWTSMMDAGTPCPVNGLIGLEAASYWENNPNKIPEGSRYKTEYIQASKPVKGELSDVGHIALYKTLFLITTGLLIF
tara:strand:+ start:64 stop:621 length:558 start_codon:yes stop_codon:yes gene_type:complete